MKGHHLGKEVDNSKRVAGKRAEKFERLAALGNHSNMFNADSACWQSGLQGERDLSLRNFSFYSAFCAFSMCRVWMFLFAVRHLTDERLSKGEWQRWGMGMKD
jgi:hypothetical protein